MSDLTPAHLQLQSRRRRAFLLVSLLLALFTPRALGTVEHEHDAPQANATTHCPACVVGDTPAASAPSVTTPREPSMVDLSSGRLALAAPVAGFSYAAPLACGPPV